MELVYISIKRETLGSFKIPYINLGKISLLIILNACIFLLTPPKNGGVFFIYTPNHAKILIKDRHKIGVNLTLKWRYKYWYA